MSPSALFLYGLAFAGGALVFGLVLLVLFVLLLLILGDRDRP
jgi:hypothetical protein